MKKILAIVLCACMICALLAGCGSSESPAAAVEGDVLKIGIFEPATGENGAGGMQEVLGARYANKVVPSVTVNGKEYKIELVEVDNQSDKTAAVTAAQNLVSSGVIAVIGSYGSGVSIAAGSTFEQAKIPAVGGSCTNPQVTLGNDYYFRVCFLDPFQGTVMASYANNEGCKKAAVIMGTGQQSAAMTAGGRLVAARETRRLGGDDKVSKLAEGLAFGSYNKLFAPNRTSCDWLSLDTENVDRYLADPLCGGYATLGLFREMLSGLDFIRDPKNLAKMNANTPVFFVAGEMDPVGDCGRGVWKAAQSFRRAGLRDVTVTIYPEARHEILNDFCREQVQSDILTWLRDRLKLAAPEA